MHATIQVYTYMEDNLQSSLMNSISNSNKKQAKGSIFPTKQIKEGPYTHSATKQDHKQNQEEKVKSFWDDIFFTYRIQGEVFAESWYYHLFRLWIHLSTSSLSLSFLSLTWFCFSFFFSFFGALCWNKTFDRVFTWNNGLNGLQTNGVISVLMGLKN